MSRRKCKYLTIYQIEDGGDWYYSWHTRKHIKDDLDAEDHDGPFASPSDAFAAAKISECHHE